MSGERLDARRAVVLSAGAVNSPKLLQLSGLGPGALLHGHGIDVVADLPAVGGNLQDHLQIRSVYKVSGRADAQRDRRAGWPARRGSRSNTRCGAPGR